MAIYKPTDCVPSGQSFDALNDRPLFVECKIDTNNAVVNGYSLELFDSENNRLFPENSEDIHDVEHITLISDLKSFFDTSFSDYGRGYIDLNTGINGSYIKIPILFNEALPGNTFDNNVISDGLLLNGRKYRWKITLYQELGSSGGVTYPADLKYYDMTITSGKVLGSTNERIQTALVADDEDIIDGLVLKDKYIQPVSIDGLNYNPDDPKAWEQNEVNNGIVNSGVRSLIENYDNIYGHIYPSMSGNTSFSPDQISKDSGNNGFRIYKNGNDPENLGASDKVYEIINYPVDMELAHSTLRYYDYDPGADRTINCDAYITVSEDTIVDLYNFWVMRITPSASFRTDSSFVQTSSYESGGKRYTEIYIRCPLAKWIAELQGVSHTGIIDGMFLYYYAQFPQEGLNDLTEYNRWHWVNTPANISQSYWEQVYTTDKDPSEYGYKPFEGYPSSVPSLTIYGKERIVFNHMYVGGAYSGSGDARTYLGSCYNGIFSPEPSATKVSENRWDVTIKWYRTTDANTWGMLLNKVVYVENGSTSSPDVVSGDVFILPGDNAEITIGSNSGVLNQTPFMFVLEKPIRLFNTTGNNIDENVSLTSVGVTSNIYMLRTTLPIGEVSSIYINDVLVNKSLWSYVVKSNHIFYTPSSNIVEPINARVVYKQYKEQDYTGVIFYNMFINSENNIVQYIKPFSGIENRMIFLPFMKDDEYQQITSIININKKYWFIKYYCSDQASVIQINTPYKICSCYRSGDLNEFGLYENPRIPVKVYDSLGYEIEQIDDEPYYDISTRAFSVEIEYEQDDYILWESCQWDLYTADKRLNKFATRDFVTTTSEKYDGRLRFVFYGLDDKQYYILRATVITNNGGKFNQDIILYANYNETTVYDYSTINFNYDDLCAEIDIYCPLVDTEDNRKSIIRVYKREIWYYQDEISGGRFHGQNSPWRLIGENALSGCIFKDYCVANGHHYEYMVCKDISILDESEVEDHWITKEEWSQRLEIDVKYIGWSIVELHNPRQIDNGRITLYDAEAKDVWRFKYNVSSGAQTQNISKTQQDTLGSYPHISVGEKNFMSGSVSCLLGREIIQADYRVDHYKYVPEEIINPSEITKGYWTRDINGELYNAGGYKEELSRYLYPNSDQNYQPQYINAHSLGFRNLTSNQAVNMINAWKEVVYSGNNKLIRDEKGRMYVAHILSNGISANEAWNDMPTEISFDWVEVGGTNQISVFENRAIGEIIIDGRNPEDVDEEGYIPAMRYSGFSGSNKIIIENPQCIRGFGRDAFNGCENILDVYIQYPENLLPGEELEYADLFDWWCTRDFVSQNSNPIHVSAGENREGVRIFKQNVFAGEYELCSSIGQREEDVFDDNYHCLNAIPSEYSVNGYKYLQDVGIDLYGLGDDNSNGSLPGGLFKGCTELTNVIIKNGSLGNDGAVGDGAFQEAESLQNVLMENIIIIGPRSFLGCSSLISIDIPNTTTQICEGAFARCVGLRELIIPGNVEYIYASAFSGCSQLSSLDLENGILEISEKAFAGCYNLKNIFVPASVSNIASGTFSGCYGIEEITIPYIQNSFGYIFGDEYYTNSTKVSQEYYRDEELVVSDYYIPSSLRSVVVTSGEILYGAFSNCSMLTSIELPDNISTIGEKAFIGCNSLTSIEIPSSVVSIGSYAFNRSGINNIIISSLIESIGESAFRGSGLDTVYFENRTDPLSIASGAFAECNISKVVYNGAVVDVNTNNVSIDGWFEINFGDSTSNPISRSGHLYYTINEENEEYELYNLCVPNIDVNNYALYGCKSLQRIEFSEDTTAIGDYAFYDCSHVESINMSSSVIEFIGEYAFYNMEYYFADGVESLRLPRTIISIGESAFVNLGSRMGLTDGQNKLYINSRPEIGANAFLGAQISDVYYTDEESGVSGWTYITFNNLYANPLYQCGANLYIFESNSYTKVVNIMFASDVDEIPQYAFAGSTIEEIDFINAAVSVGDYAFYNCSKLRGDDNEDLPLSIRQIGDYAFSGTIVRNVWGSYTSIGIGAFANSFVNIVNLIEFTDNLPEKLFSGCSHLWSLGLSNQTTSMSTDSLYGCIGLTAMWAHVNVINNFAYKMNLQNVTIYLNATLTSSDDVPSGMFENSAALQRVRIVGQDSLSHGHTIGANAFKNCTHLSVLDLEDSNVSTIKEGAFRGSIISSVTIPDFVLIIEPYAFQTYRGEYAYFTADQTWAIGPTSSPIAEINTSNLTPSELGQALMGGIENYWSDQKWTLEE